MFQMSATLGIRSDWVVRNDSDYIVLYKRSSTESRTWVLQPVQAYVLSFFDGRTDYRGVIRAAKTVFGFERFEDAKDFIDQHITAFNAQETIVCSSDGQRITPFTAEDFFIPLSAYRYPDNSRLRLPTKLGLFLTAKCHADCAYCYVDRSHRNAEGPLAFPQWKEIIDDALSRRILNLDVLGGDPLADPDSFRAMLYLLGLGIPTFLSTKCEITPFVARALLDNGVREELDTESHTLQLSIDSVRPETADFLTGTRGFLDRVDRSVAVCREFGLSPVIKAVLTPVNCHEVCDIIDHFRARCVGRFQFVQYGISHYKYRRDLFLSDQQKWRLREVAGTLPQKYPGLEIAVQDEVPSEPEAFEDRVASWRSRARCTGGYSSMVVVPTGEVIPCEQMPQEAPFILGDVRHGGIEAAWRDPRFDGFLFPDRSRFAGTPCEQCAEFDECHFNAGFCYRDALLAYGTVYEAPPDCPWQTRQGRRLV